MPNREEITITDEPTIYDFLCGTDADSVKRREMAREQGRQLSAALDAVIAQQKALKAQLDTAFGVAPALAVTKSMAAALSELKPGEALDIGTIPAGVTIDAGGEWLEKMEPKPSPEMAAFIKASMANDPIAALEARYGFAINRDYLAKMAETMTPDKDAEHGRLVYALTAHRIAQGGDFVLLDIGTGAGFSAACMALATAANGTPKLHDIWSVDVIDPTSNMPRLADETISRGIWDYCEQFIPGGMVPKMHFVGEHDCAHIGFLARDERIGFAFVDGDKSLEGLARDLKMIMPRQQAGDIILIADLQITDVDRATVTELGLPVKEGSYSIERVALTPSRSYAIAVRQ